MCKKAAAELEYIVCKKSFAYFSQGKESITMKKFPFNNLTINPRVAILHAYVKFQTQIDKQYTEGTLYMNTVGHKK